MWSFRFGELTSLTFHKKISEVTHLAQPNFWFGVWLGWVQFGLRLYFFWVGVCLFYFCCVYITILGIISCGWTNIGLGWGWVDLRLGYKSRVERLGFIGLTKPLALLWILHVLHNILFVGNPLPSVRWSKTNGEKRELPINAHKSCPQVTSLKTKYNINLNIFRTHVWHSLQCLSLLPVSTNVQQIMVWGRQQVVWLIWRSNVSKSVQFYVFGK